MTKKQIRIILKKLGMKHGKPYPHDYRRAKNAEYILKKLPDLDESIVIGFMDETHPRPQPILKSY